MYLPVQRQFINFCTLDGYISPNESMLPNNEQTLLCFCSHLDDCLHHSSVKVYGAFVAGCQKWKSLETPGTQPPFSDAVVN